MAAALAATATATTPVLGPDGNHSSRCLCMGNLSEKIVRHDRERTRWLQALRGTDADRRHRVPGISATPSFRAEAAGQALERGTLLPDRWSRALAVRQRALRGSEDNLIGLDGSSAPSAVLLSLHLTIDKASLGHC